MTIMNMKRLLNFFAGALSICILTSSASAQDNTSEEIEKYRELLADGNPAELWELTGEELWYREAGPKNKTLETCDLGKGPGVVEGAYVEMPRYFSDVDKVMDLEQRLIYCRMMIQGLSRERATERPFGSAGNSSDIEALVAYVTGQSRGMKIAVAVSHEKEKRMYEMGKRFFYFRAGSHDFGCVTCHSGENKRIRLQELPNFMNVEQARKSYGSWPAYRVSQGEVRSMQHRLYDCLRQQRFPEAIYGTDLVTAISLYLAKSANGGTYDAPAMKR